MNKTTRVSSRRRFTIAEKRNAVLRLLRGESPEVLGVELGVTIPRLERWRNDFLTGGSGALGNRKGSGPVNWFSKHAAAIFHSVALLVVLAILVGLLEFALQHAEASRGITQ